MVVALSLFISSVCAAGPVDPGQAVRSSLPEVDFGDVAVTSPLSAQQHAYLKPKQHRLPQNPYAQTDFTAYTLEWGEVKLGLIGAYMGILPRIQVGTQPLLDVMGIANVNGKFNLARTGPVDIAVVGSMHRTEIGEFTAEFSGAGGLVSIRMAPAWSLHLGGLHGKVEASGLPNEVPSFLAPYVDHESVSEMTGHLHNLGVTPNLSAKGTLVRVASDVRFNRRDSLLFQGTTFLQSSYSGDLGDETSPFAEDILGILVPGSDGASFSKEISPETRQYVLTVSYQMSFRQFDVRMGGGQAANPLAWIIQGNDAAWRFGGKTRAETRRTRRGWRVSGRRDLSRQETPSPERAIESTSQRNVGSGSVSRKE